MVERGNRKGKARDIPSKSSGSGRCGLNNPSVMFPGTQDRTPGKTMMGANLSLVRLRSTMMMNFFEHGKDAAPVGAKASAMNEQKLRRQVPKLGITSV